MMSLCHFVGLVLFTSNVNVNARNKSICESGEFWLITACYWLVTGLLLDITS